MHRLLLSGLLVAATASGFASAADAPPPDKVRIQVILRDTSEPLRVYYNTKGSIVGGLFVPFFAIGNMVKTDQRGEQLTQAVGSFSRADVLSASLKRVMSSKYPVFDLEATQEGADQARDADLIQHARDAGFRYFLLVDENFAGLISGGIVANSDQVSVATSAKIELFDVAKGNQIFKSRVVGNGLARQSLDTALASGDFFRANYDKAADLFATIAIGQMFRSDQLHAMASSIGKGDQVPAVSAIMARYAVPMHISAKPPPDWHVLRLDTPYAQIIEPKNELRYKLGIRIELDLLLGAFGQDVSSIQDYMTLASTRFADGGLDPSTLTLYEGDGAIALPGYTAYTIRRQGGTGGQLMFLSLLDKPYLAIKTVIATEDLDGLLAAHRTEIEAALRDSQITIDPAGTPGKN